jgi:hypothetical protein
MIVITKPFPIPAQFRSVTSQFPPVPLDFSHIAPDFRFPPGNLVSRCSPAYVAAQLGAVTPKFSEILAQLRPTPLNITVTLPDCAAPFPVRSPAVAESRIAEQ